MTSLLAKELYRATALTFERLAFTVASPDPPKDGGMPEPRFEAATSVDFAGAAGGRLTVAVYGGVLPAIVGNMVGAEHASNAGSRIDALGELANVICGSTLTRIMGGETFRLDAPRAISQKDVAREQGRPAATCARLHVEIDEGAAEVILNLDRAVSPGVAEEGDAR